MEIFQDIESWSLAVFLRQSIWAYPLLNTAHLLGVALLIGSIAVLDLRILGLWRRVSASDLASVLGPVAVLGFVIAVLAGSLLFTVQAKTYAVLWLFQVKMVVLLAAAANAFWLMRAPGWRRFREGWPASAGLRVGAGLSFLLWLAVLIFGRLIGYA